MSRPSSQAVSTTTGRVTHVTSVNNRAVCDAAAEEPSDRTGWDPLGRCYSGLLGTKLVAGLEVHVSWHCNRRATIPKYCGMLVQAIRAVVKRESLVDAAGLLIRYFNNGAPPGVMQKMAGFRAGEGCGCARPG